MCINRMKKVIHKQSFLIKPGVPVMTIKYTKEQLNKFDKELLI